MLHWFETCPNDSAPSTQHILDNAARYSVHCSEKYTLNSATISDAMESELTNVRNNELNFQ
jgi:hypothetical protein